MAKNATCRQFELELAAYLEGEDRPVVSAHAGECDFCRAILVDMDHIRLASRQMALEEPPARVWANIRATLAQEGMFHAPLRGWSAWFQPLRLLPSPAPLVALAGLTILAATLLLPPAAIDRNLTSNAPIPHAAAGAPLAASLNEDSELSRTLQDMEKSYQARQATLDPAEKAIYQKSLESLDTSIDECRDSVRREPGNTLAREYLLAAYVQKAEVLESVLEFGAH